MTTRTKQLEPGTIAYDLAQHEPVVVIDADVGTIEAQDDALEEMIRGSPGNQAIGFDPDTQCVEVMFANLDGANDSTYTFPETRLGVPRMSVGDHRLSVREYVQFQTLRVMMAEAIRGEMEMEASVTGLLRWCWSAGELSDDVLAAVEDDLGESLDAYVDS